MSIPLLQQFFLISLLCTTIILTKSTHAHTQCQDDQKALLLELKNGLIFNPSLSRKLVQWNQTDDCCSWEGVECDGPGHVISLQLDYEAISGGLKTSSSLFSLTYLKKLNLALNNFNRSQIPRGIGNLTNLTHLNLSYAAFGGQIPMELSVLTRLVSLDISNSYFPSFDRKSIISNWDIELVNVTPVGLISDDIFNSYFHDEARRVIFPWRRDIQPLKLEDVNLLQNLTSLRELYLDGVEISSQGSEWCHVISSFLPELRNLSLRLCNLSGPLDPSLLHLKSLSVLRLDWNNLSTRVPEFLSNFSSLITLSFKKCSLKGSLSEEIFQIPSLQKLDLSNNELLGSIPATVANLTELVHLDLSSNLFSGLVPPFYMCKKLRHIDLRQNGLIGSLSSMHFDGLSDLAYIDLSHNNLTGSLSSMLFQGLSHLEVLSLGHNSLDGSIPMSLFGLPSLKKLALSNNLFNGNFQLEEIQRLRYLTYLDLSYNNLFIDARNNNTSLSTFPQLSWLRLASCNLHSFPDLRNQSNLRFLDLSNNRITGKIPNWVWETGSIKYLNLSCNLLMNLQTPYKIPSSLEVLDLHSNLLHGELPLPIPSDTNSSLLFFSLANNSLTGAIPNSLCNYTYLTIVDLSFNDFSGDILSCLVENIEYLQVLNLGKNKIRGDIPDKFSSSCGLETLDLNNNNLGGKIPKSLKNCKSLVTLNVGNNNIGDSFPCMLPSSLRLLVLRSNKFHGGVRCRESWPNLQIIDIAFNNFSGNLDPMNFSSWRGMMSDSHAELMRSEPHFILSDSVNYYQSEVTLVIKGQKLKVVKIWEDFASIDFSSNNFQGTIPSAIGDLSSLDYLNLSHNALTGSIPKSFGKLRQLGSLDLSVNQLTGVIPMEIAGLTFLEILNLSHNMLVGKIPNGPQIQTFSADSFEGNMGLCGLPLNLSCSNTHENDTLPPKLENVRSHGIMEIEWDYVSAALGCVVGLGGFVWVLLCCQSLSRRYFEKIDEILEKIFDCGERRRR